MINRNVGEIEIEVDVVRIRQNRLAKKTDRLRSVAIGFVGGRRQIKDIGISRIFLQQRLQCGDGILGMLRHELE